MNNYRLRLVAGTACASAAATVVTLHLLGWLHPGKAPLGEPLFASPSPARAEVSAYRVTCVDQLATLWRTHHEHVESGPRTLRLLDSQGRMVICSPPQAGTAKRSLPLSTPAQ